MIIVIIYFKTNLVGLYTGRKQVTMLKVLFHLVGALQFFYGCYYDHTYVRLPSVTSAPYGGKFKYLTFLNAMLQTLYFFIALANDFFGSNEKTPSDKPLIRRIKDTVFSSLAFPLASFVSVLFWVIYGIDRELILPRSLDPFFPQWLNHLMHTNILIFALIELVTSFRMYPNINKGLSVLISFMLCYAVWIHVIYFKTGTWVYPVLAVLNWPVRIIFYVLSLAIVSGMYCVGERLNALVWSKEVEQTVKSGKKKAK